jgi:hypothetical protein
MKKMLMVLGIFLFAFSMGNSQTDYMQWEAGYITAKAGQGEMFKKGLAAHNKKFHNADPYKIAVFSVLSGQHSGQYFLGMGPVTFTQIEGRPSGDEHRMDWQQNVLPYVESEGETDFWRLDKQIQYKAPNSDNFARSRIRFVTLLPEQRDRYKDALKQVLNVLKTKGYAASWNVYWKWGASTGPDVITEINMEHWSYFDRDIDFQKDFEEVNGEGSYDRFLEELKLSVDMSKTYDELWQFMPELSSN